MRFPAFPAGFPGMGSLGKKNDDCAPSISPSLNSFCLCIIFSLKTLLNTTFDIDNQTNTQEQKKIRIFGDVEIKVKKIVRMIFL